MNAPEGLCGGIVACNEENGKISLCHVEPVEGKKSITFKSTKTVGGVAAQNAGLIEKNILKNVIITNDVEKTGTCMGIVAGENLLNGMIRLPQSSEAADAIKDCRLIVKSNYCKAGGVAGVNAGTVEGAADENGLPDSLVNNDIEMEYATVASIGGVTGHNTGKIANITVDANIKGNLGSDEAGYGGIAGFSGYGSTKDLESAQAALQKQNLGMTGEQLQYPAVIENCSFDGDINAIGSSGSPVCIGGIAGMNGYGSKVEACFVGVRKTDSEGQDTQEAKQTYIVAGDRTKGTESADTDTNSYANIGGIAGENYGAVLACDNASKSTDQVYIIGFAGETGGIVGYNNKGGKVTGYLDEEENKHYISTADSWKVEQRCAGNTRGPGGIIGKTESEEGISYAVNRADISCMFQSNNYAGGIVGILQSQGDNRVAFTECENYGKISSYRNSSGIIGELLGCAAELDGCINWGEITAMTYRSAGMVAYQYFFPQGLVFRNCENHGNLTLTKGESAGRMSAFVAEQKDAYSDDGNTCKTYLYNCVNTGILQDTTPGHTSVNTTYGVFGGNMESAVYLELCRNYNTQPDCVDGFIGADNAKYEVVLKNCFDNSNTKTKYNSIASSPFTGTLSGAYNAFYLDENSTDNGFQKDSYGVYFSIARGKGDMQYNDMKFQELGNPAAFLYAPGKANEIKLNDANPSIWMQLDYAAQSQGLDSIAAYFWNGSREYTSGKGKQYSCQATFYYQDGTSLKTDTKSAYGYYNVCDEAEVVLKNPSATDKKPVCVKLTFSGGSPVLLRGFSFIPQQESEMQKEAVCHYLGEEYDTGFTITSVEKMTEAGETSPIGGNEFSVSKSNDKQASLGYPDDVLNNYWDKYEFWSCRPGNMQYLNLTFEVSNGRYAPGMDQFVFYLTNDNKSTTANAKKHYNDYYVTFIDENDQQFDTPLVEDAVGIAGDKELSRQAVAVPDGCSSNIKKIILHIRPTRSEKTENGKIKQEKTNYVFFSGFGWVPSGEGKEQRMATAARSGAANTVGDHKTTLMHNLQVSYGEDETPYVYSTKSIQNGFYMSKTGNDPIGKTYYADRNAYMDSKTVSEDSGSRIDTYLDMDPKIVRLMEDFCIVNRRLSAVTGLKQTEANASVQYSWKKVQDAYGYQVYYEVSDESGACIFTSEKEMLGSLQTSYDITRRKEWPAKGKIVLYIRAINAYHMCYDDPEQEDYTPDYEKYDSAWVNSEGEEVKRTLPKPEIHLEVVAGDKMVAVLDNYEEYEAGNCTDSIIVVKYRNKDLSWNLAESGKYSRPVYVDTGNDAGILQYYAAPNESIQDVFSTSSVGMKKGEGLGNKSLPDKNMYCDTYFQGFFGTDPDSMEYRIRYQLTSADSYLLSDISAYDEKIGATVSYDQEITHAANSYNGGVNQLNLTSTLKNLPKEWFSEKGIDNLTVRSYPYRSQLDIIHYGHEVAGGITLNGATPEENRRILADIVDAAYFAENADSPVENPVWDAQNEDLKAGYILQKQDDGTYDIYYSAVLESSMKAAAGRREQGEDKRIYYNYAVCYNIYQDMSDETEGQIRANSVDFQESYWIRRLQKNSENYSNVSNCRTDANDRGTVQEKCPAPVVEDTVQQDTDAAGNKQYTFKWDTFYKDIKGQYNGNAGDKVLTNAPQGLFATWDHYLDIYKKAGKAALNNQDFNHLMNAYYDSYQKAKYRVDLIGITMDGREIVLDSKQVDAPKELKTITTYTDENGNELPLTMKDGKTTTAYTLYDFECSFSDTQNNWGSYPRLVARIMRLGSLDSIKYSADNTRQDSNGSTYLLPRYTEKEIGVKSKLSTISKPTVTLCKVDGKYVTTDLVYEIKWAGITDAAQRKDLGGYLITACVNEQEEKKTVQYYYVSDCADQTDTINLDLNSLRKDGVVSDVTAQYEEKDGSCKTLLDLSGFQEGDSVDISVKAIARKKAVSYTDSEEGVSTSVVIPKRLDQPDIGNMEYTVSDNSIPSEDLSLLPEDYEKGVTLRYKPADYGVSAAVQIEMAVAVYDRKDDSGAWNQNAVAILADKSAPINLGDVSQGIPYTIRLTEYEEIPGQFAGKWLKITLRATCPTEIDSVWTDRKEDGCLWIPIPGLIQTEPGET